MTKIAKTILEFGNRTIELTVNSDSVNRWEKNGMIRDYFDVKSDNVKVPVLMKFYEVITGSTRDNTITANGRTFAYDMSVDANSKTKRRACEVAAQDLANQL